MARRSGRRRRQYFLSSDCRLGERLLTPASRVSIGKECVESFVALRGGICDIGGAKLETSSGADRAEPAERRRVPGGLVRAIVTPKFEQIEPLGAWFVERLAEIFRRDPEQQGVDVVVPVPLHRQRPLAKRLKLRHRAVWLMRKRPDPTSISSAGRSAGSRCVALLPHVRAAKLTNYASYW
jgi:predicted amidophosphoribosyltransferase